MMMTMTMMSCYRISCGRLLAGGNNLTNYITTYLLFTYLPKV